MTTTVLLIFGVILALLLEIVIFYKNKALRAGVVKIGEIDEKLNVLNYLSTLLTYKTVLPEDIVKNVFTAPCIQRKYQSLTLITLIPEQIIIRSFVNPAYVNKPTPLETYVINQFLIQQKNSMGPRLVRGDLTKLSPEEKAALFQGIIADYREVTLVPIFYLSSVIGYLVFLGKTYEPLNEKDSNFLNALGNSLALIIKMIEFNKTLDVKEQFKATNVTW